MHSPPSGPSGAQQGQSRSPQGRTQTLSSGRHVSPSPEQLSPSQQGWFSSPHSSSGDGDGAGSGDGVGAGSGDGDGAGSGDGVLSTQVPASQTRFSPCKRHHAVECDALGTRLEHQTRD